MFKNRMLKKLSAGFMAGLCAFSMLGANLSGTISAKAASVSTENSAFPSADTVIAKAAELLGTPYTFGNKGYWGCYDQGEYSELSVSTIKNLGIDCSGLVYYTLTQLGYSTSIILMNLLDNAIEACSKNDISSEILLTISKVGVYYQLLIENTIDESVLQNNKQLNSCKSSKNMHGWGLNSIKDIVERHDGMLDIYEENDRFCVSILLKEGIY